MITRAKVACTIAASTLAMFLSVPAQALTMQECSAKYKAAQTAGTLSGQKWNDFRKAECGSDAAATPAAAPAAAPAAPKTAPAPKAAAEKKAEKPRTAASLQCSKDADAKGVHGKERKKFMSECKKAAADKPK